MDCSALHDAIRDELAALEQVVATLKQEQAILTHAKIDQLADITERKSRQVAELENLSAKRNALMQSLSIPDDGSAIADWLGIHSPATLPLWQTVIGLAREASQLNRSNGKLVSCREDANRELMRILLKEQDAASGYSADGRMSSLSAARRRLDRA